MDCFPPGIGSELLEEIEKIMKEDQEKAVAEAVSPTSNEKST